MTSYDPEGYYDEEFEAPGQPRPGCRLLMQKLASLSGGELYRRQKAAESALLNLGVTFNVYGNEAGDERIFPFDVVPRVIQAPEWARIEQGLMQRVAAMNLFIEDVYNDRKILSDHVVPEELIASSTGFLPQCMGLHPPKGVWFHVAGIDLVRDGEGTFYVLEDNIRCPSGVAYVLENRQVMKQTLSELFDVYRIRPVDDYPSCLLETLQYFSDSPSPRVVLLTPGIHNSAYYEHSLLAQLMGIELVEGRDLEVVGGAVHMRTTNGLRRVDVIYRRINDEYLDPRVFRNDSILGVPGLMEAYRKGRVAIANAPGTGVADDKSVYPYVPKMIRYYLDEEPILPNVPTFVCSDEKDRRHVLDNLDKLVVKAADGSGGYGMLIGPQSSAGEREDFAMKIQAQPRKYIAQPTLSLSRVPTIVGDRLEGRHVDLRPFVLTGKQRYVMPGGLTRVALQKGSLVVNSSQGGGSKDTWVLS